MQVSVHQTTSAKLREPVALSVACAVAAPLEARLPRLRPGV